MRNLKAQFSSQKLFFYCRILPEVKKYHTGKKIKGREREKGGGGREGGKKKE